jgi:predicted nucleotidyltransferase
VGFVPSHENAFALIWNDQTLVDLIPFGAVDDENRKITVTGTGYTTIDVPGFFEMYDEVLLQME